MEYYLQKTFYKTASLISNSCKCVAILAGQTAEVSMLAYNYGQNLVCDYGSNCFKWCVLLLWIMNNWYWNNNMLLVMPGTSISVDWWCSWFHWDIKFTWKGLFVWHSPCNDLVLLHVMSSVASDSSSLVVVENNETLMGTFTTKSVHDESVKLLLAYRNGCHFWLWRYELASSFYWKSCLLIFFETWS